MTFDSIGSENMCEPAGDLKDLIISSPRRHSVGETLLDHAGQVFQS